MFIDCESYDDINSRVSEADKDGFVSPGYFNMEYGIGRQVVHNWIKRDVITAYRYEGKEGYFIFIPLSEVDRVYEERIKRILARRKEKAAKKNK